MKFVRVQNEASELENEATSSPKSASEKSYLSGTFPEKSTSMETGKATPVKAGKATSDYLPVDFKGVMDDEQLKTLLIKKGQREWTTKKRIGGIQMILNYFARKRKATRLSTKAARGYVSYFQRPKKPETIKEPLTMLVSVGLLEITQKAVVAPHCKLSASYRLNPVHGKPNSITAHLTPSQIANREGAEIRREKGLNARYPTRAQLIKDLSMVGVSDTWHRAANKMMINGEKEKNIRQFSKFLNSTDAPRVTYDRSETANHSVMHCPKELKPHLTLAGESVSICDMASAHIRILLRIANDRIRWTGKSGIQTGSIKSEVSDLRAILDSSDIYDYLSGSAPRKPFKKQLLQSLNTPTNKAIHIDAYLRFKARFPHIIGVIEALKKNDHRALNKQLRYFTAQIIEAVMLEAQSRSIPCLSDTDALIVPLKQERYVRNLLDQAIKKITA